MRGALTGGMVAPKRYEACKMTPSPPRQATKSTKSASLQRRAVDDDGQLPCWYVLDVHFETCADESMQRACLDIRTPDVEMDTSTSQVLISVHQATAPHAQCQGDQHT